MCMCCTGRHVSRQANSPCSMRVFWNGKPHKIPGFSQSQKHRLTALVPPCPLSLQSQGSLDRIKWVILQSERALSFFTNCGCDNPDMLRKSFFTITVYWKCWAWEEKRTIYCLVTTSDLLGWPLIGLCHCCLFYLSSGWWKLLFSLPEGCFSTGQFIWLSLVLIYCICLPLAWLVCRLPLFWWWVSMLMLVFSDKHWRSFFLWKSLVFIFDITATLLSSRHKISQYAPCWKCFTSPEQCIENDLPVNTGKQYCFTRFILKKQNNEQRLHRTYKV